MKQAQIGMADRQNFQNCVSQFYSSQLFLVMHSNQLQGRVLVETDRITVCSSFLRQLWVQCVGMWPKQSQSDSAQNFHNQAGNKEIPPKQMRTRNHIFCWMNTHLQQKRFKKAKVQRSAEKGERAIGVCVGGRGLLISSSYPSRQFFPHTHLQEPNPSSPSITCK